MKNLNISIIIIGYNTSSELKKLLLSINNINASENILEVIYTDDGSRDLSCQVFNSFKLLFNKKSIRLKKNRGRAYATQKGIEAASGKWYLFVRSNERISKNIILEYQNAINKKTALAYMGKVQYNSTDAAFVKYLNNPKRGIASFSIGKTIHYKFLLFNNSLIRASVFNNLKLDVMLNSYGGEELEFAFRLSQKYPNMICASPNSIVYRDFYPTLDQHCRRLEEFGSNNFLKLSKTLQLEVVYFPFLLKRFFLLKSIVQVFEITGSIKYIPSFILYYVIRLRLLVAILKGYYKAS